MKCQNCAREIKLWQSACPYCQNRTQSKSFSTISEAPDTSEQNSRRRLLQYVLQFSLVALTFIALAGLVRLNPPKANPLPPVNLRAATSSSPLSVPTPEVVTRVEVPVPVSSPATPAPKPIFVAEASTTSLFSAEDLRLARYRTTSPPVVRPAASIATTAQPSRTASTFNSTEVFADEALPKKMATPLAPSGFIPSPTTAETDAKLELETAGILLPSNTGLVTIKSYVSARVYIDGVYSGSTPRSLKLLAGEHTINLLADGYQEYSRKVKISGQQQLGILASMSKK